MENQEKIGGQARNQAGVGEKKGQGLQLHRLRESSFPIPCLPSVSVRVNASSSICSK